MGDRQDCRAGALEPERVAYRATVAELIGENEHWAGQRVAIVSRERPWRATNCRSRLIIHCASRVEMSTIAARRCAILFG